MTTASDRLDDAHLAALRAGDPGVLADTLALLLPRVRSWLHRLLGGRADVDDAVQEALVALARALPAFEGRAALTTFAHRVVVRTAYRYYDRPPEVVLALVPPAVDQVDPESSVISREALRRLYRAIEELPARRRVAFVLCAIEGLSPGEAAEVEGCTGFTMRARLARARGELEKRLADDPYLAALARRRS